MLDERCYQRGCDDSGCDDSGCYEGVEVHELLGAIAHEVGNLLAAIRLHAHGIEHDLSPRQLAASVVSIDSACARAGALVGLVEAIVAGSVECRPVPGAQVVETLREELVEQGTRGAQLRLEISEELPEVRVAPAQLHSSLLLYAISSLDAVGTEGRLRVRAQSENGGLLLLLEDDSGEPLAEAGGTLRGRGLALALLREVVRLQQARIEVESGPGRNAVRLLL